VIVAAGASDRSGRAIIALFQLPATARCGGQWV